MSLATFFVATPYGGGCVALDLLLETCLVEGQTTDEAGIRGFLSFVIVIR
jgi:hypothetical protein